MNKKNKILVGCLALLLVLSVGYAIFSDTITINGTAAAKGEFQLTTECISGLSPELNADVSELSAFANQLMQSEGTNSDESIGDVEGGYENDSCTVKGNTVNYTVDFLYPSAMKVYTFKVTNTGTIPAVYDFASYTDEQTTNGNGNYHIDANLAGYYYEAGENLLVKGVEILSNGGTQEDVEEIIPVVNPGESFYVVYMLGWRTTDEESSSDTLTLHGKVLVPFNQVTTQ